MLENPKTRFSFISAIILCALFLSSCATKGIDRCYVTPLEYDEMRKLFVETESMQRVIQEMAKRQWLDCEQEQVRYQLAKDFYLDELVQTSN